MIAIDYLLLIALLAAVLFALYPALTGWLRPPAPMPRKRTAPDETATKRRTSGAASSSRE